MATKKTQEEVRKEQLEQTVSKTEQFYNENKKTIWCVVIAAIVIAAGVLSYNQLYLKPLKAEAMEQTYPAEAAFRDGNFEIALNGDGNNLGFAEVISQYGAKAGQSVYFYAGVCALEMGDYDGAISYLKKYNGKDEILKARATACIGDAYVGLEQYSKAVSEFEKAAKVSDNVFAAEYLVKAAAAAEEAGDNGKALSLYETVKDKYPQSIEGYEIDKYINRIKFAE